METNQKIKTIFYCRVSSKEQEETGYSLEAQEKLLTDYANEKGFDVVKIYKVAESASGKQIRKTFLDMIDFATKEEIDVILCEKIDRLTRNLKDAATASDWVLASDDREIHFIKENFVVSKNTRAHENFVWDMKVAMARFYTNNLSEEVKKGQKEKIAQGWLPTTPPLGYKTIGEKGHKIHVVDDKVAPYIKKMFELYASGNYSTQALGKKMYELGFRSRAGGQVVKSKIHKLLAEPFYYGKFIWKGKEYQGQHEPIITRDLFMKVRDKMTRVSAPYHRDHFVELRGKMNCGSCGKTVSWELQKGRYYGSCKTCKAQLDEKKKYASYDVIEDRLLAHIDTIAPQNDKVLEVLKKALKESHSEEIAYHEAQVNGINASLNRIQQRKNSMYDDRLDGRISTEFYDEKLAEFKREEETLTDSLKKLKADNTEYYKVGISIHELALKARDVYKSEKATVEERRQLLSYAFTSIAVLRGEVDPTYTKGFSFLVKWMPRVNESLEPVEETVKSIISSGDLIPYEQNVLSEAKAEKTDLRTPKKPYVETQKSTFVPSRSVLLRGLDSNQRPTG